MKNFQFMNPTKIIFGKGQLAKMAEEIPAGAKVLVLYGGGSIKKNGLLAAIHEALADHQVGEFGGIEPNPSYETLMKAVEKIKAEGYDFLLAAGGGSVIDGTKFIAAAVPFADGDPWRIIGERIKIVEAMPFGTVLTLPATGSEMNNGAVITHKALCAKLPFMSPLIFPRFSILDPEYTYTLPPRQIGNGVVDAFVHVMEQYLTYPAGGKLQDRFAEGLLLTLIEDGPEALKQPENYEVRANIMWSATMALNGLIGSGVPQDWSTHMIGHEITAIYGLDHAQSLAVVLPSMLEVMQAGKREKLLQYGECVWHLAAGTEQQRIDAAIACTRTFFETMGLPTKLEAYGVGTEAVEAVADSLEAHGMTKLGETGAVTLAIVRQVLGKSIR